MTDRGYYTKRKSDPDAGDPRLALLPSQWFHLARVLDVGCNTGKVTLEIAQRFGPYRITGVDIDAELISLAKKQCPSAMPRTWLTSTAKLAWSRQSPLQAVWDAAAKVDPKLVSSDAIGTSLDDVNPTHFPLALSRMYGYLPDPPGAILRTRETVTEEQAAERTRRRDGREGRGAVMGREMRAFPDNVQFKHADWVNDEPSSADQRGYNVILALSVSKWIHLNDGDDGIRRFFARVFRSLLPEGRFVLEAQPWSSYAKARAMHQDLQDKYAELKLRPDDFERVLLDEIGFESVESYGESDDGGFKRPLKVFRKAGGSFL